MSVHTYACLLLKEKHESQAGLAAHLGTTLTTVNQILMGRRKSRKLQGSMAEYLGYESWESLVEASDRFLQSFSDMGGCHAE